MDIERQWRSFCQEPASSHDMKEMISFVLCFTAVSVELKVGISSYPVPAVVCSIFNRSIELSRPIHLYLTGV